MSDNRGACRTGGRLPVFLKRINKNIVVAWGDGEVTCKRLQLNHSPILLVPDNRDYKLIQVSDETLILDRVVGLYEAFING